MATVDAGDTENVGSELVVLGGLPLDVAFVDSAGTRANALEENDSDREPSRSISMPVDVVGAEGAAVQKIFKYYSLPRANKCIIINKTTAKTPHKHASNYFTTNKLIPKEQEMPYQGSAIKEQNAG